MMKNSYIFFSLFVSVLLFSQDLTGRWVELLHDDAINGHAEMIIEVHQNNNLYGYGFDTTIDKPSINHIGKYIESGRCSYTLVGRYDSKRGLADITDTDELYNVGHAPGRAVLEYYEKDGKQYLEGLVGNRPGDNFVYGAGDLRVRVKYVKVPDDYQIEDEFAEYYNFGPPDPKNYLSASDMRGNYNPEDDQRIQDELQSREWELDFVENFERHEEKINDIKNGTGNYNDYFTQKELAEIENSNTPSPIPDSPNEKLAQIEEIPEGTDNPNTGYFSQEELNEINETPDRPIASSENTEEEPPVAVADPPVSNVPDVVAPVEIAVEDTQIDEATNDPVQEETVELAELQEMVEPLPEGEQEIAQEEVDPLAVNYQQDLVTPDEKVEIEQKYASRNTKTIANIRTQDKVMKVVVKDYGEQDGDEISIIVDDKVLYRRLPITTLQKNLEIVLASDRKQNEIIFVAENLGRVPPNTARIELYLNGKKYSYSLLTDTNTNAKIVLQRN